MNGNDPAKTIEITFYEPGGIEAVAWIADDIFAVIVKGGFFYVIRLDDENVDQSKNLSPNRGCKVIFKKQLDLQGETR